MVNVSFEPELWRQSHDQMQGKSIFSYFTGHFVLNVVQKDSNYDMIICKGIYLFHFRLDCNVQFTIEITGRSRAYVAT